MLHLDVKAWRPNKNKHENWEPNNPKFKSWERNNNKFRIWEVQAFKSQDQYSPIFGAHAGIQSLFFSDQSLYLLVYDMGIRNPKTFRPPDSLCESDSDDECSDDEGNEYANAHDKEEADRALEMDIRKRVLSWVSCIAQRVTHAAILPIALVPSDMPDHEFTRRCEMMKKLIADYVEELPANTMQPRILLDEESVSETVASVSLHKQHDNMGPEKLERLILEIVDASSELFCHNGVGTVVPPGTKEIMDRCQQLKRSKHKLVLVNQLIAEFQPKFSAEAVMKVLDFLASIGEVLYFGRFESMPKNYVILSRSWLVSAVSFFLRRDLKEELLVVKDQHFYDVIEQSPIIQTFTGDSSSCPILWSQDLEMLWQTNKIMAEALQPQQTSQFSQDSTSTLDMFRFLERLLVHTGVFLPLNMDQSSLADIYFIPSLLPEASSRDVWTYNCFNDWKTTLCHSWLFRNGAPAGLMEQVAIALLRDLYEHSHVKAESPTTQVHKQQSDHHPHYLHRAQTVISDKRAQKDFINSHDGKPIMDIKIHQINCWKNSLLIKIGRLYCEGTELKEVITEIFVALTDQASSHSVASDVMRPNWQRLVASGKGQSSFQGQHNGQKIWEGGYKIVLNSIIDSVAKIEASVANNFSSAKRQVICPICLESLPASDACWWGWDSIRANSCPTITCEKGHVVDKHLICGTVAPEPEYGSRKRNLDKVLVPYKDLVYSVVIVGLWNNETKTIEFVGSGFIANKKLGLIVTAAHTLFDMDNKSYFGVPYKGLRNARAIIGVIPSESENGAVAVFRYFAEIVAYDVHYVDACVLRITTRLEKDVHNDFMNGKQTGRPENILENVQGESLSSLEISTSEVGVEQSVRIIGFNQGGEGRYEKGEYISRSPDYAEGYICKLRQHDTSQDSSSPSFQPRKEIVANCVTIGGHSGGPCVNHEGRVVGILSRTAPADGRRCYLVPSSEIKTLLISAETQVGTRV